MEILIWESLAQSWLETDVITLWKNKEALDLD